jgi:hypothetical protein
MASFKLPVKVRGLKTRNFIDSGKPPQKCSRSVPRKKAKVVWQGGQVNLGLAQVGKLCAELAYNLHTQTKKHPRRVGYKRVAS